MDLPRIQGTHSLLGADKLIQLCPLLPARYQLLGLTGLERNEGCAGFLGRILNWIL